jgi:Bacterial regulatory proteins, tetR family
VGVAAQRSSLQMIEAAERASTVCWFHHARPRNQIIGDCLRLRIFFCMPTKRSQPARRKPRTDAQRNRERILEVAKEAFTRSGANTSLDNIAKQAGVGAGTLYRHFPTRDALLEASIAPR